MFAWLKSLFARGGRPASDRAAERAQLRARYDAAQTNEDNRRHWANADALSAKAANSLGVRKTLRERSRYECDNNGYAGGLVLTIANDTIGTGPTLHVQLEDRATSRAIETLWYEWAEASGFAEKLHTSDQAKTRDGEAFGRFRSNPNIDNEVKLDIEMIECDQCTTSEPGFVLPAGKRWVDGIIFDQSGNPETYHILRDHPGDQGLSFDGRQIMEAVSRFQIIHWFRADRPGQARGVPEIKASLPLFAQLRRFTLATLTAAETAADFAAVLKTEASANGEDVEAFPFESVEIDRGMMTTLPGGYDLAQLKAEHPTTTYEMFVRVLLREAGRPTSTPLNVILGDASGYNYSSARLDHLIYRASILVRREHCRRNFVERVFREWLKEARAIPGYLPRLPDGLDYAKLPHKWTWPGFSTIDPLKEAQAATERLSNRTSTLAQEIGESNEDWEEQLEQAAREEKTMKRLGLQPANVKPATSPKAEPADDDQADDQAEASRTRPTIAAAASATPSTFKICGESEPMELVAAEADAEGKPKLRKFSMVAYTGGAMRLAGFFHPVVVDLAGVSVPSQRRPILRGHDPERIVGHTEAIEVLGSRIKAAGIISGAGDDAAEIIATAGNGFPWQASIGASVEKMEFVTAGNDVKVNGRNFTGPIFVARATTLGEISFVPMGADGATSANVAAQQKGNSVMDENFLKWLAAKGIDPATLPDAVKAALQAGYKAELAAAATPAPAPAPTPAPTPTPAVNATRSLDEIVAAQLAENSRVEKITGIVAKAIEQNPNQLREIEALGRAAIEGKWEVSRLELEVIRASRNNGPGIIVHTSQASDPKIVEAAVAMSVGLASVEKRYEERTLEAARRAYPRGIGLKELLLMAARTNNNYRGSMNDEAAMCRAAFRASADFSGGVLASGPSSIDVPGILSNVANKSLEDAWLFGEQSWRGIAKITNLRDFKTATQYRLSAGAKFQKVPATGEIKHGTLSELTYNVKADTYGIIVGLSRTDIINDDLGAFASVADEIGRGAIDSLNTVFWVDVWLASQSSYFPTNDSKSNYISGASTPLSIAGLNLAEAKLRRQTKPDGTPLGLMPAVLLTPATLANTAAALMNTSGAVIDNADVDVNVFKGRFRPVSSVFLDSTSDIEWWLLTEPRACAAIQVGFLNGVDRPTIATSEFDFDRLGLSMRGYLDFGVAMMEYRAGVRSKGTS